METTSRSWACRTSNELRARAEINSHFGASAGRADARRRDEGDVGHRRGAATTPIRALRRRAPSGCGPQARWLCCSLLTYRTGYCSSLAPRQRAWGPAAKCTGNFFTDPWLHDSSCLRGAHRTRSLPRRPEGPPGFSLLPPVFWVFRAGMTVSITLEEAIAR